MIHFRLMTSVFLRRFFAASLIPMLLALPALAASVVLKLEQRSARFEENAREKVLVSACSGDCQAITGSRRSSLRGIDDEGGASPGPVLCRALGGEVVSGEEIGASGDVLGEQSACQFTDGSMVTTDSLHARAARNDRERGLKQVR